MPAQLVTSLERMELRHSKQLTFMRGMLDGKCYYKAWEAMEFAAVLEQGYRKDGKTPKFHHQLQVARLVATLLPHLTEPENTLAAAFLHDELEDNFTLVSRNLLEEKFGHEVASAVWKLSKKCGGLTKTKESYFEELSRCPIASLVKLADRGHNLHTMQGVFSVEKQIEYVKELDDWFFPMLRAARKSFPRQYAAYENLKILLLCQRELLVALLNSGTPPTDLPEQE